MYNVIARSHGTAIAIVATYDTWAQAVLADCDKHRFEHADTDVTALTVEEYNGGAQRSARQQQSHTAWVQQGAMH
jgi:hypothetical protein